MRFHMLLIIFGILAASLFCNRVLLNYGFNSMFVRFPLNVTAGYLVFFLLIRLWLFYIRQRCGLRIDRLDFSPQESPARTVAGNDSRLDRIDAPGPGYVDEVGCAVVLLLAVIYVFLAGGLVLIYGAPAFLSETAASFFLVGALSGPIREIDIPQWAGSIFSKTWPRYIFSLLLSLVMALCALILCPKANTIVEIFKNCI